MGDVRNILRLHGPKIFDAQSNGGRTYRGMGVNTVRYIRCRLGAKKFQHYVGTPDNVLIGIKPD
jgi:hypothetical protein